MSENRAVFETMPVPKALAKMAVPTIISQLITMIYNLADTYYIGSTNDPYKVASVSLTFVMYFILNALANLFGVGGSSLISRLLGVHKEQEAKKVCAMSLYGSLVVSVIYCTAMGLFLTPILRFLGASDYTLGYASDYVFWVVVIGGVPTTLSMTMAHLLRSEGYSKQASFGLGMGGVLNIILDPLFMFVILPAGNEVTGAAAATLLANIFTFVYFIVCFYCLRKRSVLTVSPVLALQGTKYVGKVIAVGFPSSIGGLLACLSNVVLNRLAAGYGDIQVAAIGIVKKIDMLPLNVGSGLCQGMLPLVAYNYSSGNYKRMRSFANYSRTIGMVYAAVCVVIFQFLADQTVGLFIEEQQTLELGTSFLKIMCLATPFMFCNFQMTSIFQAMGKGPQSLLLASCRQGLINIPLLFLMERVFGLYGIVWTQFVADLLTTAISFALYRRINRDLKKEESTVQ